MTRFLLTFLAASIAASLAATAAEPIISVNVPAQRTKATFLITGLHCAGCTRTIESSLGKVKGIRSVKVDWKTKNAQLEFDESVLPSQKIAQLIAATPHMMGGNMHYGGWLALRVPELKDDTAAQAIKDALRAVQGVKQTVPYQRQHFIAVQFGDKGRLTSQQLIDALKRVGFQAESF